MSRLHPFYPPSNGVAARQNATKTVFIMFFLILLAMLALTMKLGHTTGVAALYLDL